MMKGPNSRNLIDFPLHALKAAAILLSAYRSEQDQTERLGDIITPEYNPISGLTFLVDTEFHVALMNGQELQDWLICDRCHGEGFRDQLEQGKECCREFVAAAYKALRNVC